jgi:hypothetical protein
MTMPFSGIDSLKSHGENESHNASNHIYNKECKKFDGPPDFMKI